MTHDDRLPKDSPAARRLANTIRTDKKHEHILNTIDFFQKSRNFCPILPMLFRFEGKPVTLDAHFLHEIRFNLDFPKIITSVCARQVGKSLGEAMLLLLLGKWIPNFNQLYITPFFEHVRRFSSNYLYGLMSESPVKALFNGKGTVNQVLQRTLPNRSNIYLSYAYRDANRTRGLNTKMNHYDEVQMMLLEVIEVTLYTMQGSQTGEYCTYSGTPLTQANTLQHFWNDSTQSEWLIPCRNCRYENVANTKFDMFKMIGPFHRDIGPGKPALICAKCRFPVFPQDGHWWHRFPDRRNANLGIHIPAPVMPYHCMNPERWNDLILKLHNPNNTEQAKYNELLGEAFDGGAILLTHDDMRRVAVLNRRRIEDAIEARKKYDLVVMGVDFGGGSLKISGSSDKSRAQPLSRTKIAICGVRADGGIDVIFGIDLPRPDQRMAEIKFILWLFNTLNCHLIAYDMANGGWIADQVLREIHFPPQKLAPCTYTGVLKGGMIVGHPGGEEGQMPYYSIDKTRSLQVLCQLIKGGAIRFFEVSDDKFGWDLLLDFTHLFVEQSDRPFGIPLTAVHKQVGTSDDFVHAVNFAAQHIWSRTKVYPKIVTQILDSVTFASAANAMYDEQGQLVGTYTKEEIEARLAPMQLAT